MTIKSSEGRFDFPRLSSLFWSEQNTFASQENVKQTATMSYDNDRSDRMNEGGDSYGTSLHHDYKKKLFLSDHHAGSGGGSYGDSRSGGAFGV